MGRRIQLYARAAVLAQELAAASAAAEKSVEVEGQAEEGRATKRRKKAMN